MQVKYFASLREQKGCDGETVQMALGSTARELGRQLQLEVGGGNYMVAVNRTQSAPDDAINDGDEVAFFPPVTGG